MHVPLPPTSIEELVARARALAGATVEQLGVEVGIDTGGEAVRTKGTAGAVLEHALGATGGSAAVVDFPDLGVELKTIPVDEAGVPIESTYVCTISLVDAEDQEWSASWARAKLSRVLFVPLVGPVGIAWPKRTIGAAVLWSPTEEQESVLRADFDDAIGLIGIGRIEELTAHAGRWLQVRPKARDGSVRTIARGAEGESIATIPRGFYLRTKFTGAILRDPRAVP